MQCPKCGYISFDHLEVCVKCKKNIKEASESLHGTVFKAQAPAFLQLHPQQSGDETEGDDAFVKKSGVGEDYIDDDLEILIEDAPEQESEIEIAEDSRKGDLKMEAGKAATGEGDEEDDREIEIDFSQFEDTHDDEAALADEGEKEEKSFAMEMPEALSDISDLAPPGKKAVENPEVDDLDFDLGLDDLDSHQSPAPESAKEETTLSLDDIDFSETLTKSTPTEPSKPGMTDMDEELNFDLDLGGLTIHKDK
jgi:hypothetical protein